MAGQTDPTYFTRDFELTFLDKTLILNQISVGDVGCIVWDAALVLSGYLEVLSQSKSLKGLRVLELGSGTGCVGLAAAVLGANVALTDLQEYVPLLQKNILANSGLVTSNVIAAELRWGTDDWKSVLNERLPDIVLVADCIYYKDAIDPLVQTLEDVSGPETEIYLSYEERECEKNKSLVEEFMQKVRQKFNTTQVDKKQYREDLSCEDIHIYKLTKK